MCVNERQPPFTSTHLMLPSIKHVTLKHNGVTTLCKLRPTPSVTDEKFFCTCSGFHIQRRIFQTFYNFRRTLEELAVLHCVTSSNTDITW